jgi:hypothetical protein
MELLNFRQFIELDERQPNYLDAIQDELGIDPKILEKNPEWAANMTMGNLSFNGIMYKIVNIIKKGGNVTGAMIQPMNVAGNTTQRAYFNKGDKQIKMPDSTVSNSPTYVSIDQLNNMLTQGMQATPAGGTGMLPGGGMP